ncbi:MAG: H-X9-DG-CTERM domain-containing protein, partial [Planctomycetota bacterium]
ADNVSLHTLEDFVSTAPHTNRGYRNGEQGTHPASLGSEGGNLGLLDGSVRFIPQSEMLPRSGSAVNTATEGYTVFF